MVEPWILLSIMAAFFQTLRFMLQGFLEQHVEGSRSVLGIDHFRRQRCVVF